MYMVVQAVVKDTNHVLAIFCLDWIPMKGSHCNCMALHWQVVKEKDKKMCDIKSQPLKLCFYGDFYIFLNFVFQRFPKIPKVSKCIISAPYKCFFFNLVSEVYLNLVFFCNCHPKHVVLDWNHAHSCLSSIISENILKNLIESMIIIEFSKPLNVEGL